MKTAYIVRAYRTAVGKAPRGLFRFKRPDELAAETVAYLMNSIPELDKKRIDDVIVGNAMPEAEQGLNMARLISLMGLETDSVPGRYCKPLLCLWLRNHCYGHSQDTIWYGRLHHRWRLRKHELYSLWWIQARS